LKSGNKGYEAGLGAVEMGSLVRKIGKNSAAAGAAAAKSSRTRRR
jgi:hypothetical protein